MKLLYVFSVLVCLLIASACSSTKRKNVTEEAEQYLAGQIIASKGYQQVMESDACELVRYYEDLFSLFILNENRFSEILSFLHEDGSDLNQVQDKMRFQHILKSADYECRVVKIDGSNRYLAKLLVNKKIAHQALVGPENAHCFNDIEQYQTAFTKFSEKLRTAKK